MKKFLSTILCMTTATAALTLSAFACIDGTTAAAETTPIETQQTLVAPKTYEEYLSLTAPTSVAVSTDHKAIADGNVIYVYSESQGVYSTYVHSYNTDATKNVISKLQFADNGLLYFLDASTYLYTFDPDTFDEAERTELVCSDFDIFGNDLYFINVASTSSLSKTTLDNLDISKVNDSLVDGLGSNLTVTHYEGSVYYLNNGKSLHKYGSKGNTPLVKYFETEIVSMLFTETAFAFTDIDGDFYVYSLTEVLSSAGNASDLTPLYHADGNYVSLYAVGDTLYAVNGARIQEFSTQDNAFTSFEIGADSPAQNRLSGATNATLVNGYLFTADTGNARVSIYDTKTEQFLSPVPLTLTGATHIAATENTLLVSSETQAALYSYEMKDGSFTSSLIYTQNSFVGNVIGITSLYGKYYLISENNGYYCLLKTQDETTGEKVWTLQATQKTLAPPTAKLFTSDVYGNLYVTYANGDVYRYTEQNFLTPDAYPGSSLFDVPKAASGIPQNATKLTVDYERSLYALSDGKLYKFGKANATYPLQKSLVYGQDKTTPVSSFAFGVEENETYLLYDGNFIVKTDELNLPTVKTIPVNGYDQTLFEQTDAPFAVVTTKENALFVHFDVEKLPNAQTFPYEYYELKAPTTALKIGQTGEYAVLAVLDRTTNSYDTALVLNEFLTELPADEYRVTYAEETQKTGYLTNAVHLYKFPYLTELLTIDKLEKNGQALLLGEINRLDYDYYHVKVVTENGEEKTGYIPKAYVNLYDGTPNDIQKETIGDVPNGNSVMRFTFLILGAAAICILIDYLVLRKKPEE